MELSDDVPAPAPISEPWNEPVNATTQSTAVLQNEEEIIQPTPAINPTTERRNNALAILRLLCESNVFSPFLLDLLTAKYVTFYLNLNVVVFRNELVGLFNYIFFNICIVLFSTILKKCSINILIFLYQNYYIMNKTITLKYDHYI